METGLLGFSVPIKCGVSLRERTGPELGIIEPCLRSLAKAPPSGPGWLHEIARGILHSGAEGCAERGCSASQNWDRAQGGNLRVARKGQSWKSNPSAPKPRADNLIPSILVTGGAGYIGNTCKALPLPRAADRHLASGSFRSAVPAAAPLRSRRAT